MLISWRVIALISLVQQKIRGPKMATARHLGLSCGSTGAGADEGQSLFEARFVCFRVFFLRLFQHTFGTHP